MLIKYIQYLHIEITVAYSLWHASLSNTNATDSDLRVDLLNVLK